MAGKISFMSSIKQIIKKSMLGKYLLKPENMKWRREQAFRIRLFIFPVLSRMRLIMNRELPMEKDFVIVTGADSLHYRGLTNFLCSLFIHIPNAKAVVFDLGLTDAEREQLAHRFKTIDLRKFDYSKYPDYFNIRINAGEYAWKPVITADIMNEFKCCICWMDAGTVVLSPLARVRRAIRSEGFFNQMTDGDIRKEVHSGTLEYMNVPAELLDRRMGQGGFVGINYENTKAREMINRWKEYALIKECIAPEGSNRDNHRQDQAVLTVLIHEYDFPLHQYGMRPHFYSRRFEFKTHQYL